MYGTEEVMRRKNDGRDGRDGTDWCRLDNSVPLRALPGFAVGFSREELSFDYVDVGNETIAQAKIVDLFKHHDRDPLCIHIILEACCVAKYMLALKGPFTILRKHHAPSRHSCRSGSFTRPPQEPQKLLRRFPQSCWMPESAEILRKQVSIDGRDWDQQYPPRILDSITRPGSQMISIVPGDDFLALIRASAGSKVLPWTHMSAENMPGQGGEGQDVQGSPEMHMRSMDRVVAAWANSKDAV
ncbi:hypothetical protein EK21DRAFT_83746 [Setomelanomma holmii]|uniref:DUF7923 domain-containing protein n=1 Tax=Setomelanomma holmii TaxID=210430 RepID=A0A9P4HLP8_9PLEO|nr:hypothetical protein EK21DRAFT_83746 [Setomelanomma holmii]